MKNKLGNTYKVLEQYLTQSKLSIGEGNGTLIQHSCLENPMDGGAWWAAVHGVTKCGTRLSDSHSHALSAVPGLLEEGLLAE